MRPDQLFFPSPATDRQLRRFLAGPEHFLGDEVVLPPSESHHITRVLRLSRGARVEVSDGRGRIFLAEISQLNPAATRLRILAEVDAAMESALQITLGLALVRSETFDLIVRQATEMGIARLLPFQSDRSLIRPESWKKARYDRWLHVAREALKSSQRNMLPEITPPVPFSQVLAGPADLKILFWEDQRLQDSGFDVSTAPRPQSVLALIGPEGGFSASEVAAAHNAGFLLLGLGPRRLRVETAALAAVTLLQYLWGDLGR